MVCGIHAYGQESCVDFEAKKRKTPKFFILIQDKWSEQWTILWFFLQSLTEIGSIILYSSGNLDWENIMFINLLIPGLVFVTFLHEEIW